MAKKHGASSFSGKSNSGKSKQSLGSSRGNQAQRSHFKSQAGFSHPHRQQASSGKPLHQSVQNSGRDLGSATPRRTSAEFKVPKGHRAIMGLHSVREALVVRPKSLKAVYFRENYMENSDLLELSKLFHSANVKFDKQNAGWFDNFFPSSQGVVAISDEVPQFNLQQILSLEKACIVALDGLEDPHNLGAILRTSWLMGVNGVIIPEHRAVGLTPSVHKVACGAVEHIPVLEDGKFQTLIEDFKAAGYWVYGLSHLAKATIYDQKFPAKTLIIIGSEGNGLRKSSEKSCDDLVSIPQTNNAASYNASVAAALVIGEIFRQQNA